MPKIQFIGNVPVPHEKLMEHVNLSKARGLPYVNDTPPHGRKLAVVGGGPSVLEHVEELRSYTDIWAVNGACRWLREQGIESTLLTLDPCAFLAPRVSGATKALLSSRCHPAVFEALEGCDITLFDVLQDGPEGSTLGADGIWASISTACVVFHLAMVLGYTKTVFYGCESSYTNTTHAYMDEAELQEFRFIVECGGQEYLTAPDLYCQAMQMAPFFRLAICDSFTERSGGLLRAMIANEDHDIVKVSPALLAGLEPIKEAA